MEEFELLTYQIYDNNIEKFIRKKVIVTSEDSTLNVYVMQRIGGFWTREDCKIESSVFNELNKSLSKVKSKKLDIDTLNFLRYDFIERITYLFYTDDFFVENKATIVS